jgi:capsular exopolysaccharide synthesis family protein
VEGDDRVDHRQFWNLVRSRWLVLTVFALVGLIVGSSYVIFTEPKYTADAELFVSAAGVDNTSDLAQGGTFSQQQARNYSVIATKELVLRPVIASLRLDSTVSALARNVSATVPLNTSIISIEVTDTSATRAARTANKIASSLVDTVVKLVPKKSDGTTPVRLEPLQNATVPSAPSAPNARISLLLGLLAGLLVGLALVILREIASTRIRSTEQIEAIGDIRTLGSVINDRGVTKNSLLDENLLNTVRGEEFRQLRTSLLAIEDVRRDGVIVVTSSIPREGKTLTAANLAIAVAATGQSVCLVDADLRKPALSTLFGLDPDLPGVSNVLTDGGNVDELVRHWGSKNLYLMASGPAPDSPSELLGSPRTARLLDELRARFDVVILDSPSLMPVTDGALLAALAGGALLVVGAGRVETRELRRSVELLEAAGASVIGALFNRAPGRVLGRFRASYVPKKVAAKAAADTSRAA